MKAILNIALVAHDSRKNELLDWVRFNADLLSKHHLYATGTTGRLISELAFGTEEEAEYPFKDKVTRLMSGPLGGDQQIGAMIAEGKIDMLIFFCDNLVMQGHQNDVSALNSSCRCSSRPSTPQVSTNRDMTRVPVTARASTIPVTRIYLSSKRCMPKSRRSISSLWLSKRWLCRTSIQLRSITRTISTREGPAMLITSWEGTILQATAICQSHYSSLQEKLNGEDFVDYSSLTAVMTSIV